MNSTRFIAILMSFCAAFPAFSESIEGSGLGVTPASALHIALRNAVEQGVGLAIGSQTLVRNYMTVSDNILTNTSGYVSSYVALDTTKEFGLYRIRVRAEVTSGGLEKDLIAQKLLYESVAKPRIMVVLTELFDGTSMPERTATYKFEELLVAKGFKVVEPEQLKAIEERNRLLSASEQELANIGFRYGADLIIKGTVSAAKGSPVEIYGKQFTTVPVQLNAHIVRADNAEIVGSRTKAVRKNSQTEFSAAQFGLETGGTELAGLLINDLLAYWQSSAFNDNTVEVAIAGVSGSAAKVMQDSLSSIPSVRTVRLRYIEGSTALYDVELRGTVQELRDAIGSRPGLKLSLALLTSSRIGFSTGAKVQDVAFEYAAPDLDISAFAIDEIFPSRLRRYESTPITHVTVTSKSSGIPKITLSVQIPELMPLPAQMASTALAAGGSAKIDMPLALDPQKTLAQSATRTLYGKVVISTIIAGRSIERTLTAPVVVHGREVMDWEQSYALGAFVTPAEASVSGFARSALAASPAPAGERNPDFMVSAALFCAMQDIGLRYVKDPVSAPGKSIDRVQFPATTLALKGGDCDDLSVLYAALLESVGIDAAVVSLSDHVFVLANSGVYTRNRFGISPDSSMTIVWKNKLWIPVETTLLTGNFLAAWKSASAEFNRTLASGLPLEIIDMDSAWNWCRPAPLSDAAVPVLSVGLSDRVQRERAGLAADKADAIKAAVAASVTSGDKSRLGLLQVQLGEYARAVETFSDPQAGPEGLSDLAAALVLCGREADAAPMLEGCWQSDPSGRAAINRALCLYALSQNTGDIDVFVQALKDATTMLPAAADLGRMLGLDIGPGANTRAASVTIPGPKKIDKRQLQELIQRRVLSSAPVSGGATAGGAVNVAPFGGIRGADPSQTALLADLLCFSAAQEK